MSFDGLGSRSFGAFDTFTFGKEMNTCYNWLDLPVHYAPYRDKMKALKFFEEVFVDVLLFFANS